MKALQAAGLLFLLVAVIGLVSIAAGRRGEPLELFGQFVLYVALAGVGVLLLILP